MLAKITYPTKTNNPSDADTIKKYQAIDANEVKSVVNAAIDSLEQVLENLGISSGSGSLGSFISLSVLQAAYPDGAGDSYAIIDDTLGGTPQVATYNTVSSLWELSTPDASIIWVANVGALPGAGIAQKLYITIDSGDFYYWTGSVFEAAGPSVTVVTKYILNNGARYKTEKGYGNIGSGFEVGDEIFYRDPITKSRAVYYVNDGNLTLPADFADRIKLDKYNPSKPSLS